MGAILSVAVIEEDEIAVLIQVFGRLGDDSCVELGRFATFTFFIYVLCNDPAADGQLHRRRLRVCDRLGRHSTWFASTVETDVILAFIF